MTRALDFFRLCWQALRHKPFNLLDDEYVSEVYVLFPKDGRPPQLFVQKLDDPNPQKILHLVSGTIQAACDLAKLYGTQVTGSVGPPPHCPSCQCPKP